jgi:putative transposase
VENGTFMEEVSQGSFAELEAGIRARIREIVQELVTEELDYALGADRHARVEGRQGYRHGSLPVRRVATSCGVVEVKVPRARLFTASGSREYQSQLVPRYVRRSSRIDAALLSCYLTGVNTRKVKLALAPLLDGTPMSRSVVSRVAKKVKGYFEAWRSSSLKDKSYEIIYLDGMRLPVRLVRRVVKVPVQVVLGVTPAGERELLELRIAPSESTSAWSGVVEKLVDRGLRAPVLAVIDGNKGLRASLVKHWPETRVGRCSRHKLENLKAHCPKHAHAELKRDFDAIVYADGWVEAQTAYDAFLRKWEKLCPEVATSLEEAGEELLTFYRFPKAMWKSLRTTNRIDRLHEEFRRRVKTQGSFPNEAAGLHLLFGLLAAGVIRLRRIDGHRYMAQIVSREWNLAA